MSNFMSCNCIRNILLFYGNQQPFYKQYFSLFIGKPVKTDINHNMALDVLYIKDHDYSNTVLSIVWIKTLG